MDFLKTTLGIEFGSTRIKAVLLDEMHIPVASGSYDWKSHQEDGVWSYSLEEACLGLQKCYASLAGQVREAYGEPLRTIGAIGISGMMHGYLAFDSDGKLLVPFRTWQNTMTEQAAAELSERFNFNIPQRWSIAHLYQAMLKREPHLPRLDFMTTLAGYIHWKLTGRKVVGIGEASGVFPVDGNAVSYNASMLDSFQELVCEKGYDWTLQHVLPVVLLAGGWGGSLTEEGAKLLDPSGTLQPGISFAPPEGDAGTGMVATNAVRPNTGNVSAGTSSFAMIVVDHDLNKHMEIDMVTTPAGAPVAMVHCNNCTSDINAWVDLFAEFAESIGAEREKGVLFEHLFRKAMEGDKNCGGLLSYNYYAGESITKVNDGRPVFARMPTSRFTLANFMRMHLMSALATLKIGLDILVREEGITIEKIYGHGGFFKTPGVGQQIMSAAIEAPVAVLETAGEGGPYGMALLAAYALEKRENETLEDYLSERIYKSAQVSTVLADSEAIQGYREFLNAYKTSFEVERAAIDGMSVFN